VSNLPDKPTIDGLEAKWRARWAEALAEPGRRQTAFALEAVVDEVVFVVGVAIRGKTTATVDTGSPGHPTYLRGTTGWFLGILAFMLLSAPIPGLPFVGPLVALVTPVRHSRWRMVALWGFAATSAAFIVWNFLAGYWYWPGWLAEAVEDH
jgi:hypothetical protein